jgi:PAS domain S-box-containing protein
MATAETHSTDNATQAAGHPRSLRLPRAVLLGLTLVYLTLGAYYVYALADRSRIAAADLLESHVSSIRHALDRFADRERIAVAAVAALPEAREAIVALGGSRAGSGRADASITALRRRIDALVTSARYDGMSLFDAAGHPLLGGAVDTVGARTLHAHPEFLARVLSGETSISPPVASALPTLDTDGARRLGVAVMFVAAPVLDGEGRRIGAIAFRIRPALRIDGTLLDQRRGRSADAFAFNREGVAVSSTRFDGELVSLGLLPVGHSAALRLRLRDPGRALVPGGFAAAAQDSLPLTRGVAAAITGANGVDVDGYRDHRGANVVGAWGWIATLDIGVAVEERRDEALELYYILRRVYWALAIGIILANLAAWRGLRGAARLREARRRAEEALRRQDESLNAIIDASPNSVIIVNAHGILTRVNATAARQFRISSRALVGSPLTRLIAPTEPVDDADLPAFLAAASREATGLCGDGTTFPIDARHSGVLVAGEHSYIVIAIDMTSRKATEEALIAAKEAAEAAAHVKSDFLAMMSHEIRTPMNGVLGMTNLLGDTNLTVEQRQYVDATKRSAQHLMNVINDVLDFSKVEAGKLLIEPAPFDLHVAISEIAELLAPRASEKRLELVVRVAPDAPRHIIGDAGRIRQVLLNLAGNALKFTESGHVVIAVHCERATQVPHFLFEVEDTGIGIAATTLDSLFQPFTQADASTTRRFGGTGLGLSISKRLVELMGGEVGVRSTEGKGSTFWFALSLPEDPDAAPPDVAAASLRGVRALVVDDLELNVELFGEWMRSWGMRVESAPGAERALAMLHAAADEGDPIRLAVVDYLMPGVDGETLGRAIRADSTIDGTSLALATSAAQRGDADRVHHAGFNAYLTKPFRPETLAGALETMLSVGPGWRADAPLITRHSVNERRLTPLSTIAIVPTVGAVPSPSQGVRHGERRHTRVLLAEDNPVNQMVAVKMLERLGCRVDLAADGEEATEMSARFPYDVVFMDVQMPTVDGMEATRRIRRRGGAGAPLYIVAMTANAMEGDRERCLDAGMNDYMSKPITPDALRRALDRAAQRSGPILG